MGEYLGDKPSSRVLRPPGGQSSNIFGGPDTSPARNTNTKPTYQSSVFSSEPEPPRPQSGNRRSNMSSNIFGSEPVNNSSNVKSGPQKISKTHQSSVFQDPQPLSEEKRTAMADHRISNIPMFSAGAEEFSKPQRRPITAPTQMPSSLNFSSDPNYATDTKPGPGVRKTARTGYKPANQNLLSTIFNPQTERKRKEKRHCFPAEVKPALLVIPQNPRVRTRPFHRNEVSSIFFSEEDVKDIKSECQKRPMSLSLSGILGCDKDNMNEDEEVRTTCDTKQKASNDTYQSKLFETTPDDSEVPVFSADDRMSSLTGRHKTIPSSPRQSPVLTEDDTPSIYSSTDHGVVCCTRRGQCAGSKKMLSSSVFSQDDDEYPAQLWSSGFNMASRKTAKNVISNDTYKSIIFDTPCNKEKSVVSSQGTSTTISEINFEDSSPNTE